MKFKIKTKFYDGHIHSWEGEPDYYLLDLALEKNVIKSFEVTLISFLK